jgi:hypothetical protein
MPTSSIARPTKIYPNCEFWFENMPSGNPSLGWVEKTSLGKSEGMITDF